MPIKINVHQIRENKSGQVAGRFTLRPEELELTNPKGVWHPLTFDFTCTNAGDLYVLEGRLESSTSQQCSRCLAPVKVPLAASVLAQFSPYQRQESEDCCFFRGDELDITEVLRENAILALPVKPLCSPDCKGLCPQCGTDLNQGQCQCKPKAVDPRLAALAKLISK